jgi:hypothetical protein
MSYTLNHANHPPWFTSDGTILGCSLDLKSDIVSASSFLLSDGRFASSPHISDVVIEILPFKRVLSFRRFSIGTWPLEPT